MFSQFHPKVTKSRSKDVFSFVLREIQLLEKKLFSGSSHLIWLLGDKSQNQKPNQTHPKTLLNYYVIDFFSYFL
jgi:hypothetical protein